MRTFFITATDTDAGKTMVAAALMKVIPGAHYWKPVQTGDDRDLRTVQQFSGRSSEFFHPGRTFSQPLSPHRAAELDGQSINREDLDRAFAEVRDSLLRLDRTAGPRWPETRKSGGMDQNDTAQSVLFVEGAGGILVPLNRAELWPDWLKDKDLSLILVCRTGLGTINHSLLSVEAIRSRGLKLAGLVFFGPENEDNQRTVAHFSGCPVIARVEMGEDNRSVLIHDLDEALLR